MMKHLHSVPQYPKVRRWVASFLMTSAVCAAVAAGPAHAQQRQYGKTVALDGNTRLIFLNLTPAGSYEIKKNGDSLEPGTVMPQGTLSFTETATTGDQFVLTLTGIEPVDGWQVEDFQADGTTVGCVDFSWKKPPVAAYVSDYMLLWGTVSGVYTDSVAFDNLSVTIQGETAGYTRCGFADGTYYFALRAHNQFDRWGPLSEEDAASVTNGNTQGPPAPQNVSVTEIDWGCAEVSWDPSGDPTVTGYVIYWSRQSVAGGGAGDYSDTLDVGNQTSKPICSFASGPRYFAVKAYTGTGLMSPYSEEVDIVMAGTDVAAPTFGQLNPPDGSTSVPRNVPIVVAVSDDKTGVDPNSIQITLNGESLTGFSTSGVPSTYVVIYAPSEDMPANTTMTVEVSAADEGSPPNESSVIWSFGTGDSSLVDASAPVFAGLSPANGATGVSEDTQIEITITDDLFGVDPTSILLFVDDVEVPFTLEGAVMNLTLHYQNEDGFLPGSRIAVRVEACDMSPQANCATLDDYFFTIAQDNYSELPDGAIVPDGFWVNDPAKPLEVHNLPLSWTVRIYDAAGSRVRNYKNTRSDGYTWTWDFTNDHGRRVARAIYLVRVTDAAGKVRQAGRFLVQTDP